MMANASNRKITVLLSWMVLFGAQVASATPLCTHADFKQFVEKTLSASSSFSCSFEVIKNSTGEITCEDGVNQEQDVYPASSIKTFIAMTALSLVDSGKLSLESNYPVSAKNQLSGGAPQSTDHETLRALIHDMFYQSSNTATNSVIDAVVSVTSHNRSYFHEYAKELGLTGINVQRKVYASNHDPDAGSEFATKTNHATSKDYIKLYKEILLNAKLDSSGAKTRSSLFQNPHLVLVIQHELQESFYKDSVTRYTDGFLNVFNKIGQTSQTSSDAGYFSLVYSPTHSVVFACLQKGISAGGVGSRNNLIPLGKIGLKMINLGEMAARSPVLPLDTQSYGQEFSKEVRDASLRLSLIFARMPTTDHFSKMPMTTGCGADENKCDFQKQCLDDGNCHELCSELGYCFETPQLK